MVWVAQITDVHLDGSDGARERFERVADWMGALRPGLAAILLTGDLVEEGAGTQEDYRLIRDRLAPIAPLIAVPGNADDLDAFDTIFGWDRNPSQASTPGTWLVPVADRVWIAPLDSSDCEENGWSLDQEPVAEVTSEIAALPSDARVLVALHHPPTTIGHAIMDQMCLREVGALEDLVRNDPRVIGVVAGHIHAGLMTSFAGKPLVVGPAVQSGLRLDAELSGAQPELLLGDVPPMLAVHRILDGRLISWFRVIV